MERLRNKSDSILVQIDSLLGRHFWEIPIGSGETVNRLSREITDYLVFQATEYA